MAMFVATRRSQADWIPDLALVGRRPFQPGLLHRRLRPRIARAQHAIAKRGQGDPFGFKNLRMDRHCARSTFTFPTLKTLQAWPKPRPRFNTGYMRPLEAAKDAAVTAAWP